tara:strand:+ start:481 stop:1236 length:756 start_codon:yes stop_codon:yes gene_type:complete
LRYFIEISYLGTGYHGWQIQPNAITIQEVLENCMSKILNSKIKLIGAGRTDSGVHANQMFAHFDFNSKIINTNELIYKLNSFLPKKIVINDLIMVKNDAHARFDAISRSYEYHITNKKNPFQINKIYFFKNSLDLKKMNLCSDILFDYNDFKCFSKSKSDVKTYNCNILYAKWEIINEAFVFKIKADRFLRNMVRAIVGTLIEVGLDKISQEEFESIVKKRDRNLAGYSVPAHALFLKKIEYNWVEILKNG